MKRTLSFLFVLLFCITAFAGGPPVLPYKPVTGLTSASSVAITGGTITNTPISGAAGSFTTLQYKISESVIAASGAASAAQCSGGQINNYGQTADATMTLPAAFAGMNFTVILGTTVAKYYRLDPVAGDSIYLDGTSCGDGKYVGIASAVVGASMSCRAFQTGASAYDIYCSAVSGAWVCE